MHLSNKMAAGGVTVMRHWARGMWSAGFMLFILSLIFLGIFHPGKQGRMKTFRNLYTRCVVTLEIIRFMWSPDKVILAVVECLGVSEWVGEGSTSGSATVTSSGMDTCCSDIMALRVLGVGAPRNHILMYNPRKSFMASFTFSTRSAAQSHHWPLQSVNLNILVFATIVSSILWEGNGLEARLIHGSYSDTV